MGGWLDMDRTACAFACAAGSYWLNVFPEACREARAWLLRAHAIPSPTLRRLALEAHGDKRGNLEGAAAFAAFVAPTSRPATIRALVAYQAAFDYLDTLSERPHDDPIANGRQLHRALLTSIAPGEPHVDYYSLQRDDDDDGYLRELIEACRDALRTLPSFAAIAAPVRLATERVIVYQSLNHGDGDGGHASFDRWAQHEGRAHRELHWWETGAAAASTLGVFALIAAATNPALEPAGADAIERAYFPWTGALTTLLDSLTDWQEDATTGMRGLIAYYASPEETAWRMHTIALEALQRASALPEGRSHVLILVAMTSFYLCDLSRTSSPHARLAVPAVLDAMGCMAKPAMLMLSARRGARRFAARLPRPDLRRRRSDAGTGMAVSPL